MLGQTEINAFLINCLGFSPEQLQVGHENKLQFLRMLMRAFSRHQPYQNLYHMSQEIADRHTPTITDNLINLFQNEGGLCWTLNMGLYHVLQEYNYDVYPIIASVAVPEARKCHIMLIINNLHKHGDMWLADNAFESPEYEPICLDFNEVSPINELPDVTCRWIKEGGYIIRQHKVDPVIGARFPQVEKGWEYVYFFKLTDYSLDELSEFADVVCYNNPEHPLHLRVHIQGLAETGDRFVRIRNNKLFIADNTGKMVLKEQLETNNDIVNAINKYFPIFPSDVAMKAIENWRALAKPVTP